MFDSCAILIPTAGSVMDCVEPSYFNPATVLAVVTVETDIMVTGPAQIHNPTIGRQKKIDSKYL